MTTSDLLAMLVYGLAFLGYVTCLAQGRWLTLGATAALALWVWRTEGATEDNALMWMGAVGIILAALWFARPYWASAPRAVPKPAKSSRQRIVVDGTNVIYWDGTADLSSLRTVVDALHTRNIDPVVFLDASTRHHLKDTSLNEKGFAKALGLKPAQITICPAGTEADAFLIKYAKAEGLPIVSNDRFGDRAQQAKGIKRIRGVMAGGKVVFEGF